MIDENIYTIIGPTRRALRCQKGNQKPQKKKDIQHNGQKKKDIQHNGQKKKYKQRFSKHYTDNK